MKTHCKLGRDAIQQAEDRLGLKVDFLTVAKEIAYGHQEKWNGSGYPEGLSGDDIPVSARLMAVADVYDALISRRVYKEGMPHEKAEQIMKDGRGSHFDPDILDAFVACAQEFRAIAAQYADSDADMARRPRRWYSSPIRPEIWPLAGADGLPHRCETHGAPRDAALEVNA
jgi:putative two-component system response regulator